MNIRYEFILKSFVKPKLSQAKLLGKYENSQMCSIKIPLPSYTPRRARKVDEANKQFFEAGVSRQVCKAILDCFILTVDLK